MIYYNYDKHIKINYKGGMFMFINISNHPSSKWSASQLESAFALTSDNSIKDIPFPAVPATATMDDIIKIADGLHHTVMANKPEVVMIAGEFTLAYAMIELCLRAGLKVVAACSERRTNEVLNEDGSTTKTAIFEFVQFREFPKL